MDKSLYHVYIMPRPELSRTSIEEVLDEADDWFRYGPGLYIIQTTDDSEQWRIRLNDRCQLNFAFFICKFSAPVSVSEAGGNSNGRMSTKFWEWWEKKETES